ncbi:MAG TPA: ABC transporter ATP-binding protein [Anaerolineaceae bacterium]
MSTESAVITVEHISKSYGGLTAVDDVSFQVERGEIFGIIGPNGAGKTTTVEAVIGMRKLDRGAIRVLGLDPRQDAAALRRQIGVQLQQAALPDAIKVWEALDLFASFYPHPADSRRLLEDWGLGDKRSSSFQSLSGGQKQRLFIALALVNDPVLVFLDELTTGLDPQSRRSTWDLVRSIRDQGKTVVLVTHFMDEAEKLCDRVAIIDRGKILALDTPRCLIQTLNDQTRVVFTTSNGFDPAGLRRIPGVTRALREGDQVTVIGNELPGSPSLLLRTAAALNELGQAPADLHLEQSSLEDVFLAVTGRKIRE